MLKKWTLILVLVLLWITPAGAGFIDEQMKAAENGDPLAQYVIGSAYYKGDEGLEQNDDQAFKWLSLAAAQNEPRSLMLLGKMYLQGAGVERDYDKAYALTLKSIEIAENSEGLTRTLRLIARSQLEDYFDANGKPWRNIDDVKAKAEAGDVWAQYELGVAYMDKDLRRNDAETLRWLTKAAEQGCMEAALSLTMLYMGISVGDFQDDAKAFHWYQWMAERGDVFGMGGVGMSYLRGDGVAQNETEALKWLNKAFDNGNVSVAGVLGSMYEEGFVIKKDCAKAEEWYLKGAEGGDYHAMLGLANIYRNGCTPGMQQDPDKAVFWEEQAARDMETFAMYSLGMIYEKGIDDWEAWRSRNFYFWEELTNIPADLEAINSINAILTEKRLVEPKVTEALKWYTRAAEKGNIGARSRLCEIYYLGEGVQQDYKLAAYWYAQTAEQGYVKAKVVLAELYQNGWGVEKDLVKAYVLLAESFTQASVLEVKRYKYKNMLADELTPLMTPEQLREAREILEQEGIMPERYL